MNKCAPLNARRLVLASGVWRWTASGGCVVVWSPSGRRHVFQKEYPIAISVCGCGEPHNCLSERAVTPGTLRRLIERHLA